jgi:voltage-gated potassium channel
LRGVEFYRPLLRSGLFVVAAFAVGVVGYRVLGADQHGWIDAVYMTVITLTTVGFSEVIDMSGHPGGRIFTTLLLLWGVGAFLYFFSTFTAFLVEGHIQHLLWRRRMSRAIERLSGHIIVCGGGHTGWYIVQELAATQHPFVLIESDQERVEELTRILGSEFPAVIGDATDDDTLRAAAIERAAGLVACVANDKDNLIATVSARMLRPDLRIVSRCVDEKVEQKIRNAGADAVVLPKQIGGLRMISEMLRPTAVSFIDVMLRDRERNLRVEAMSIAAESPLVGETVGDLRGRDIADLLILALSEGDEPWTFAPPDDRRLEAGTKVVYMAGPRARDELERLAGASE